MQNIYGADSFWLNFPKICDTWSTIQIDVDIHCRRYTVKSVRDYILKPFQANERSRERKRALSIRENTVGETELNEGETECIVFTCAIASIRNPLFCVLFTSVAA